MVLVEKERVTSNIKFDKNNPVKIVYCGKEVEYDEISVVEKKFAWSVNSKCTGENNGNDENERIVWVSGIRNGRNVFNKKYGFEWYREEIGVGDMSDEDGVNGEKIDCGDIDGERGMEEVRKLCFGECRRIG